MNLLQIGNFCVWLFPGNWTFGFYWTSYCQELEVSLGPFVIWIPFKRDIIKIVDDIQNNLRWWHRYDIHLQVGLIFMYSSIEFMFGPWTKLIRFHSLFKGVMR